MRRFFSTGPAAINELVKAGCDTVADLAQLAHDLRAPNLSHQIEAVSCLPTFTRHGIALEPKVYRIGGLSA